MLDEIGCLPAGGQAKLLRLLENKNLPRVGGVRSCVRRARHRAYEREPGGRCRRAVPGDLFFRLNVIRIAGPALREHLDDVPTLGRPLRRPYNRDEAPGARISPRRWNPEG